MSSNEEEGWQRTSPLAALFYLGKIYQAIARNALQSLAPLAAFLVAFRGDTREKLIFGIGAFAVATIVMAIVRYRVFRYRIGDTAVLVRDGLFRKTQLDIRFERVQAVNTEQNVLYRLFDLVTLSFDTAGSSGQEGYLPAIRSDAARDLRDRIRRTPKLAVDPESPMQAADGESPAPRAGSTARTLVRLSFGDIVRIGLSSGRVFLLLVFIGPVSEFVEQEYRESIEGSAVIEALSAIQVELMNSLTFGILLAAAFIVLLFAVSIAAALLRYHRYELVADNDVLRSTAGLLTRHEHSVNRNKVQSLHAIQNVVLRLFGRFRVRARQASSGRPGRRADFVVPICKADTAGQLGEEFFPSEFQRLSLNPKASTFVPISARYVRSRVLLAGVLPALLAVAALWPAEGAAALLVLLWIPLAAAGAWRRYRCYGVIYGRDGVALRSGLAGYTVIAWLHRKVQRISITQSPMQRRHELATLRIHLAAGSEVKIPYVDYRSARAFMDYVLYRVESSREAWH